MLSALCVSTWLNRSLVCRRSSTIESSTVSSKGHDLWGQWMCDGIMDQLAAEKLDQPTTSFLDSIRVQRTSGGMATSTKKRSSSTTFGQNGADGNSSSSCSTYIPSESSSKEEASGRSGSESSLPRPCDLKRCLAVRWPKTSDSYSDESPIFDVSESEAKEDLEGRAICNLCNRRLTLWDLIDIKRHYEEFGKLDVKCDGCLAYI